eukprot:TRINITY_DN27398_c0_g1_i1.p1 TRINITY_DN27398_c0_g1~~TRINITY_DN27398_c0_g1_i1.p1  ORF type:complete len:180 (-),score=20.43 TRINITY_DN27398_c0_g1_i1:155-694(-)
MQCSNFHRFISTAASGTTRLSLTIVERCPLISQDTRLTRSRVCQQAQAPQPAAATGTGFASASGSLFGGAVPRASGSLFGGGAGAVTTTTSDEGLASKATDIDRSDPGSASQLRAQFERRPSIDDDAARKSWAPKLSSVPLPNGGETRVHAGSDVGGAYKAKTSFNKPPPERKSFADLP